MDERTRKLMICIRSCIPEMTLTDYMCQEKRGGGGLTSIEGSINASIREDYIEKSSGILVTATRSNSNNMGITRTEVTRKQKWEVINSMDISSNKQAILHSGKRGRGSERKTLKEKPNLS